MPHPFPRPIQRGTIISLLCAVVIALLTACGGAPKATSAPAAVPAGEPALAAPQTTSAGAAPAASAAPARGGGAVAPGGAPASPAPNQPRLLIKTGTLSLLVKDTDTSVSRIRAIALQYGGDVLQYTNTKSADRRVADVVIQVDSREFESAMQALRDLPDILERRIDKAEAQDVTEEFVDVQAQIKNLQLTEQQLRAVLEKATRTEDILAIQREITNVRGQIEKLQGRANYLERRSAMSNISLRLEMPIPLGADPAPAPGRSFTGAIARSWSASLAALETVGIAVVSVAVFCWWLVPLLLVGWLLLRFRRARAIAPPSAPPPAATPGAAP